MRYSAAREDTGIPIRSVSLALALLGTLVAPAVAQDLAALLVGRWEGEVRTDSGTYARALVIKSIEERSGGVVVEAEFGGPGEAATRSPGGLTPVKVEVERLNKEILLRFVTVEHYPVILTLHKDGRHLFGTVHGWSNVGRSRGTLDFDLRLEKAK